MRLLNLVAQCGRRLQKAETPFHMTHEYKELCKATDNTAKEICASIAYHLYGEGVSDYLKSEEAKLPNPRALGGLFLMWPLFTGSILPLVPDQQRIVMRSKLSWIGKHLGIGQATVLANVSQLYEPNWIMPETDGCCRCTRVRPTR